MFQIFKTRIQINKAVSKSSEDGWTCIVRYLLYLVQHSVFKICKFAFYITNKNYTFKCKWTNLSTCCKNIIETNKQVFLHELILPLYVIYVGRAIVSLLAANTAVGTSRTQL